jgi:hypothetical protein
VSSREIVSLVRFCTCYLALPCPLLSQAWPPAVASRQPWPALARRAFFLRYSCLAIFTW